MFNHAESLSGANGARKLSAFGNTAASASDPDPAGSTQAVGSTNARGNSAMALCPVSATYTLASASTATPNGDETPLEIIVVTPPVTGDHFFTALSNVS